MDSFSVTAELSRDPGSLLNTAALEALRKELSQLLPHQSAFPLKHKSPKALSKAQEIVEPMTPMTSATSVQPRPGENESCRDTRLKLLILHKQTYSTSKHIAPSTVPKLNKAR